MFSKRSLEGYLMIDHRMSPGISQEDVAHVPDAIAVGKGQLFESATNECSHCQRGIILNPLRTRERGYCHKCDKYICTACSLLLHLSGICRPYQQLVDEIYERIAKGR